MTDISRLEAPEGLGNARMGWVSDVAAEILRRIGVKYISLNPGASYRGLHDSIVNYLGNRDPQMLLCLHEDHAVSIAQGYAKATGEPMACALHSNVGLMHGMMGIFNAWCDRAPVIVMGATGPVDAAKRRPWIDWIHTTKDQGALLRNFTKFDDEPRSAEALIEAMYRANIVARTPPMGPVYVCLDAGLQETELAAGVTIPDAARFEAPSAPTASAETVAKAADILIAARNPYILAGRGSRNRDDWDRRVRLAELLGAGVITDVKNAAVFPTDHKLHVGPPSNWPRGDAKDLTAKSDALLALDWVDLAGTLQVIVGSKDGYAGKLINCTLDSYAHNGWSMDHFGLAPAELSVLADPDAFVADLLAEIESRLGGTPRWDGKPKRERPETAADLTDDDRPIAPSDIGAALSAERTRHAVTLCRVSLGWDGDAYDFREPLDYLGSDGGGGLGSGAGSAIGSALGLKESGRVVVSNLGDGEFLQGSSALWTAAHYGIPALWIVSNNRSNFNDEVHQQTVASDRGRPPENKWIGQRISDPEVDLAGLARSQGIDGVGPLKTVGELKSALAAAMDAVAGGHPTLLDVHVAPGYSAPLVTRASGEAGSG